MGNQVYETKSSPIRFVSYHIALIASQVSTVVELSW